MVKGFTLEGLWSRWAVVFTNVGVHSIGYALLYMSRFVFYTWCLNLSLSCTAVAAQFMTNTCHYISLSKDSSFALLGMFKLLLQGGFSHFAFCVLIFLNIILIIVCLLRLSQKRKKICGKMNTDKREIVLAEYFTCLFFTSILKMCRNFPRNLRSGNIQHCNYWHNY